jgi:branched-subunit amino acid aminotransferase/4-amino-4-deoxychorismate lyase
LEGGALSGITRRGGPGNSSGCKYQNTERGRVEELIEVEEAFVTNSIPELMPLTWFEGKPSELARKSIASCSKVVDKGLQ